MSGRTEQSAKKETRKEETKRRQRRRDTSLGSFKQRMTVPKEVIEWARKNDKTLRWINDERAKIPHAQANDWDFVKYQGGKCGEIEQPSDLGDCYSMVVGREKTGQDIRAYLMCKNKDWYEDDQAEKQKDVDQIDKAINAGKAHQQNTDGQYVKDIKYEPKGRLKS